MNFIDTIRNLFNINKNNVVDITNISDNIQIPKRDYYSDNKEMILLIDKYKNNYLDILVNKNIFVSKEINVDNLQDEIKMHIDLLLRICDRDDSIYEDYFLNNTNREIQIVKLKLYLNDLYRLENETIARLISLKEIIDEYKRLSKRNKNIINIEINNLSRIIIIFMSQKVAIEREIDSYLKEIEITDSDNDRDKLLNDKLIELTLMINRFMPEILLDISLVGNNDLLRVAYLETEIEKYVYKNKDIINELFIELELLDNETKDIHNKESLLNRINELEYKFKLFYKYGRKIITDEDMYNLYRVKFDILTIDICGKTSPFLGIKEKNAFEYECYVEVLRKKIEKIFRGENEVIKEIFGSDSVNAIRIIKNIVGNDIDILLVYNLNFVLSFDGSDGFDEYLLKEKQFSLMHDYYGSTWDYYLSYSTLFFIYSLSNGRKFEFGDFEKKIFRLCVLKEKHQRETDEYRLPDGAICLINDENDDNPNPLTRELSIRSDGKKVICPDSLLVLDFYKGFFVKEILDIELNQGIEKVSLGIDIKSRKISIPSSVKEIRKLYNIDTILFEDYKNSNVLNDYKSFVSLVIELFYYEEVPYTREFVKNDFVKINRGNLYQASYYDIYKYMIKIKPKFDRLILLDKEGYEDICINGSEISFILDRTTYDDIEFKNRLTLDNLNMIIDALKEKIGFEEEKNLNSALVKKRFR